ncbi:MAG TPA: biotin--[acetyl-CoA-carboxylase] ligase [Ktedonobacterales bacterium]|jgi:BirA family biotin operon repressor/biotin-[acetyl-CoA-carboxylase] ligase|nr:biotin--[acetyl-CoA-carboxylase] ligase [Ktedonobacterales bacterium]
MDHTPQEEHETQAPMDVEALRRGLAGLRLGTPLIYVGEMGSTNAYAGELARDGAAEGTLVTTDYQSAGRGRVGRVWKERRNQQLALSLVLRPSFPPHFLVMASALAVAQAIEAVTNLRPDIKWPNDVLISGRKVCGILIETSAGVAVLGMGVNVNGSVDADPELASRATTLQATRGQPVSREALAVAIITRLDARYGDLLEGGAEARRALRESWRERLVTLGRRAIVRQRDATLAGLALDVDDDGALLLRLDDGRLTTVLWGDVE